MAGKKKTTIIEAETKSGIKFKLDSRIRDDTRLSYYLVRLQDETLSPMEQSSQLFKLLHLIFGSEDGLINFMNEVAAHHDGVARAPELMDELRDIFESLKVKN